MFTGIHELSVFVSAVLSVAIGSIWYSPLLFGKSWMRSAGLTLEDEELTSMEAFLLTVKGVLLQTVFFFAVAVLMTQAESLVTLGTLLSVLLVSFMVSAVVWERRPLSYLLIHAGYGILALAVGIGIIAYWPW